MGDAGRCRHADQHGHRLTGASAAAREHYERAVGLLRLYSGDPLAAADEAVAESPGFAMAHVLRAWLNLLGTEPAGLDAARAAWKMAAPMCRTAREKGHHAAVGQLIEGRWHDAAQTLLRLSADHPHDLLALQVGHQIDFFTGNARALRHFIELRGSEHAEVEIRKVAVQVLEIMRKEAPNMFADYTLEPLPDGTMATRTTHVKV